MSEHVPAITQERTTNGYREGWDRHEACWVLLAPPPPGASPAVLERYRAQREAEQARYWPPHVPTPPREPSAQQRQYNNGYRAGYRAALRKHGITEEADHA